MSAADGVVDRLRAHRVLPVLVVPDPARAAPLAAALADGGLPVAEVTFRTPGAAEAVRHIARARPDVLLGAGTVLTPAHAAAAVDAGAHFVVSPGLNPAVVEWCQARGVPVIPGVCTPSEIEAALRMGLGLVKLFPAEPMGGVGYLAAVAAPYGELAFVPTGGVRRAHLPAYLATGRVVACGGSWMAPAAWVAAGEFERVREETAATVAAVAAVRDGAA